MRLSSRSNPTSSCQRVLLLAAVWWCCQLPCRAAELPVLTAMEQPHPAADGVGLAPTSWRTLPRPLSLLGVLTLVTMATLAGAGTLRRRVRQLTELIRRRLEGEASLEARYRDLVENANDIIYSHDLDGNLRAWSRAGERILGYTHDEIQGMNLAAMLPPDQLALARAMTTRKVAEGGRTCYELEILAKDGRRVPLEISSQVELRDGKPVGVRGIARDITERRRADQALRQQQALLQNLIANIPCSVFWKDRNGVYLGCNANSARDLGLGSPEEVVGKTDYDLQFNREEADFYRRCDREVMEGGRPLLNIEETQRRPDGSQAVLLTSKVPLRDAEGQVAGTLGAYIDITARKRAEQTQARLTTILEATPDLVAVTQLEGPATYLNPAGRRLLGVGPEEQVRLSDFRPPGERDKLLWEAIPTAVRDGVWQGETAFVGRHGRIVPVSQVLIAHKGPHGNVEFLSAIARDITERKQAEEALRASEEQLRQAQKMEAVGRLAGGVAHDFNNLLTIISGFGRFLLEGLGPGDPRGAHAAEVVKAADRAADLTAQLLAFGRKQMLAPQVLDLNALILHADKMLRRLIGEDVRLVTALRPSLGQVRADPGQLHQVILNLAVNARDAMPQGGTLTIETAETCVGEAQSGLPPDLKAGPYVVLTVRDTGCGMNEEILSHLFEPFFTTKELGKGTGLGLSTTYGIVKQSGGHIQVESRVGKGTTFKIYLPRMEGAKSSCNGQAESKPPGGTETVLLVEDEQGVRSLTRKVLQNGGYTVLEASDGEEAVALCQRHAGPIHLLLTDVVMPRMSGRQLAERLAPSRPGMRVLYVSGYTDEALGHRGVLDHGTAFLQKPFAPAVLARKVREVLEQRLE